MPVCKTPVSFGEANRRLRAVAQLRKLWRAYRNPQERFGDDRLARPIVGERSPFPASKSHSPRTAALPSRRQSGTGSAYGDTRP
jgi:hypothetical protein